MLIWSVRSGSVLVLAGIGEITVWKTHRNGVEARSTFSDPPRFSIEPGERVALGDHGHMLADRCEDSTRIKVKLDVPRHIKISIKKAGALSSA